MNNTAISILVTRPIIMLAMPMTLSLAACVPTSTDAASVPTTVVVAAGQQREGIDLNGGYVDIPYAWPKRSG